MPTTLPSITVGPLTLTLRGDPGGFAVHLSAQMLEPGLWLVELAARAPAAAVPPPLGLFWAQSCCDIHAMWRGDNNAMRGHYPPDWGGSAFTARACSQAPVVCLYSQSGVNRLTFASDDALHPTTLTSGIHEESATFTCGAQWFGEGMPAAREVVARLRLDLRERPFARVLNEVAHWWETRYPPCTVPEMGRLPMYSTWYSFHQAVEPGAIEAECRLAKAIGCEAVIVDDGWQTLDGNRGYTFCGDWEPERIPDLAGHVRRVHELGLKFLLWYSVPFVGLRSKAYARFTGMYLSESASMQAAVLDPRFPSVREHLIGVYERALIEWDLDGFKLDFVDAIARPSHLPAEATGGRDIADVDEAVVRLLNDIMIRLRARKPDILIEFRQSYVGPLMRTFGNLFRAGDCPGDAIGNRIRTLDLRMLCGNTACHSDMVMWHSSDPVASAALQILNVLFSVPQISVRIATLPADHRKMLAFWLGWWRSHRTCLLDGVLSVAHPEAGYTQAEAHTVAERIVCVYGDAPVAVSANEPTTLHLVNAKRSVGIIVDVQTAYSGDTVVLDAMGTICERQFLQLTAGLHRIAVPPAGLVTLHRQPLQ